MSVIQSRVVNIDELKLERFSQGDTFAHASARVAPKLGARDLGYSYRVIPPGKTGFPFHSHQAVEEMFFIVRGNGTLRYGSEKRGIRAGDFICCPTGGAETAHQIINDSDAELAYVAVGVEQPIEICEYPDSGKVGAYGSTVRHITRADDAVDYWHGEK
jgi:uncharacterized cupin superfamily protein